MHLLGYPFAFLIGLVIGSFYTATASRVLYYYYGPARKNPGRLRDFLSRRSFCMSCERRLDVWEITPFFGYFLSKGRCRSCRARLNPLYPAAELFPALLLPLLLYSGLSWPAALLGVLLCGHLYVSIATDYNYYQLDHENAFFLYLFAAGGAWFRGNGEIERFLPYLYTSLAALGIFLLLFLASRMKGMGFGDVILIGALALYAGFPWTLVLVQAAALGSIVHAFLIRKDPGRPGPFGVFLSLGAFFALTAEAIWNILKEAGFI